MISFISGTKLAQKMRVALVQMLSGVDKTSNLNHAKQLIAEAASNDAKLVVLPECFNSPYGTQHFSGYAETIPGPSCEMLSNVAKEHKIWLVGGSIPEREGDKFYNTLTAYSPSGEMICKHRKVHLFDIDVPGKIRFQESEVLTAGNTFNTFEAEGIKIGVGICYDVRFAEMARLYTQSGCKLLIYPGAFNLTTGPLHWNLLARARAVDNQLFVCMCSPARDTTASYVAYGHSVVVDPWGAVIADAQENEVIIYADLDMDKVTEVRKNIPILTQRRTDLYDTIKK